MLEPSKEDLEKAKEITKGYFSPLIQEDEKPWKYFNEKIAQALAELRAEGESFVAEAVRQVEASDKLYRQQCQKINTLEEWVSELQNKLLIEAGRWSDENLRNKALEERVKELEAREYQLRDNKERAYEDAKKINPEYDWGGQTQTAQIAVWGLIDLITRLKAENEQYWALAKQHQEALKSSQKALGEMKLYHHNAKEEVHRLTSALAAAQDALESAREVLSYLGTLNSGKYHEIRIPDDDEPVLPQRKEWVDFIVPLNKKVFEKVNVLLSDPTGQAAFEKWKAMEAVVEASRICHGIIRRQLGYSAGPVWAEVEKLRLALEALEAKGGVSE